MEETGEPGENPQLDRLIVDKLFPHVTNPSAPKYIYALFFATIKHAEPGDRLIDHLRWIPTVS